VRICWLIALCVSDNWRAALEKLPARAACKKACIDWIEG
jgi:hypothetical protein